MNFSDEVLFYSWFIPDFLERELKRLCELFFPPDTELPDVKVVVASKGPRGEAAHFVERGRMLESLGGVSFSTHAIVMYVDYHRQYPAEYKLTLLHEMGHLLHGEGHDTFEEYWAYLRGVQQGIREKIIPDKYRDFLYCTKDDKRVYTYACSGCGIRFQALEVDHFSCDECDRNMLVVGGL